MSPGYDVNGTEKSIKVKKVVAREPVALESNRMVDSRTVPLGLLLVQIFPVHMMYVLGSVCKFTMLFEKYPHIAPSQ